MNIEEGDARSSSVPSPQQPHKCIKSIVVDPRLSQTTWSLETTKIHNFHAIRFVISNLLKICIDHRIHIPYNKHMQHIYSFAMYWLLHVIYVSLLHTVWLYILCCWEYATSQAGLIESINARHLAYGCRAGGFGYSLNWLWNIQEMGCRRRFSVVWYVITNGRWNRKHEVDWQSSWPRRATWGAVEKLVKCGYGQWIKSGELGTGTGI